VNLFRQAAADNQAILGDTAAGFSWPITVTDPNGRIEVVPGWPNDVHLTIDPQTGQAVGGRTIEVAFNREALAAAGFELPHGEADETKRPWILEFEDARGNSNRFAIAETWPDSWLPIVRCRLEFYRLTE
jgi:hypothetical protein